MCEGLGWFTPLDYKRLLLLFDRIQYLLPADSVKFEDVTGRKDTMVFPPLYRNTPLFAVSNFTPNEQLRKLIFEAAEQDARNPEFAAVVEDIPISEALYTWRVANSDGDLGRGKSPAVVKGDLVLAHALLLNKFLLAADSDAYVPISGKDYIYRLIAVKLRSSASSLQQSDAETLVSTRVSDHLAVQRVTDQLIRTFIPDDALSERTEVEILEYKDQHRALFSRFSCLVRSLVEQVRSSPWSPAFERDLESLMKTDVWNEKAEIEEELQSAWSKMFRSALKATTTALAGGSLAVVVLPFFGLSQLTVSTLASAAAGAGPWLVSEFIDLLSARGETQRRGLYYLMGFPK